MKEEAGSFVRISVSKRIAIKVRLWLQQISSPRHHEASSVL